MSLAILLFTDLLLIMCSLFHYIFFPYFISSPDIPKISRQLLNSLLLSKLLYLCYHFVQSRAVLIPMGISP